MIGNLHEMPNFINKKCIGVARMRIPCLGPNQNEFSLNETGELEAIENLLTPVDPGCAGSRFDSTPS